MLVLVRHGQATANAEGLLLGRTDVPLTEEGRRQVAAIAPTLGPVVRAISSPLRRALDSAEILGLDPEVDDRWVEVDYGEHEGRALSDVPAEIWQVWQSDASYRPSGGESLLELGSRVREACEELFSVKGAGARSEAGDVVVVSHVSPIKAAVAWALDCDDSLAWRLRLSTGSVTRIGWGPIGPVLEAFNLSSSA